ncbi:hypothetical protein EI94DRAFT_1709823 [Lactarius quietus]|nr:hypothetical protein EI94DRAFT_1709823 [Lactarius quietus]
MYGITQLPRRAFAGGDVVKRRSEDRPLVPTWFISADRLEHLTEHGQLYLPTVRGECRSIAGISPRQRAKRDAQEFDFREKVHFMEFCQVTYVEISRNNGGRAALRLESNRKLADSNSARMAVMTRIIWGKTAELNISVRVPKIGSYSTVVKTWRNLKDKPREEALDQAPVELETLGRFRISPKRFRTLEQVVDASNRG